MGNFRSSGSAGRGGFGGSRGRSGGFGGRSGGRGGFGGNRSFGGRDSNRGPVEMHDAVCSKCAKQCQVPFKPTGNKPVLCSDCFRQSDSGNNFGPRSQNRSSQSGVSAEQFDKLNTKLDRIIKILEELEIVQDEEDEDSEENLINGSDDDNEEENSETNSNSA